MNKEWRWTIIYSLFKGENNSQQKTNITHVYSRTELVLKFSSKFLNPYLCEQL